jgi:hypothetical protein
MASHIIQKTIIDMHYEGNADGFALQQQLSDWCNRELASSLEATLEKIDTGDTIKKIDKIELQIDAGNREDWLSVLSKEIILQLRSKLEVVLPGTDTTITEETREQHFFESFIYFLQNGYLPWWSPIINTSEFSIAISMWLKEGLKSDMKINLLQALPSATIRQRLIGQLTEQEFITLAVQLYPDEKSEVQHLYKDANKLMELLPAIKRKSRATTLKHIILKYAGDVNQQQALQKVASELAIELFSQIDVAQVNVKNLDTASKNIKAAIERFKAEAEKPKDKDVAETVNKNITANNDADKNDVEIRADVDGIYIYNTGLIILAPFLSTLFKRINILDEFKILDKDLAVCLAQYLVTGNNEMTEFELVLPKILCGLDPEELVNTDVEITKEHKKEADELLLSVIEYWSILKNTSIEGLRESFLQRKGKLSFNNNKWLLQAEQKPFDMLLNQLPWSIQMIQLSWMKNMVETEWGL